MRKLIGAAAAALLVSAGSVLAAEQITGNVMLYDEQTGMLTLKNGATFLVAQGAAPSKLEDGQEVTVSYEKRNGQSTATKVELVGAQGQQQGEGDTAQKPASSQPGQGAQSGQ